jgi:deoxyribodipyrimidine photo-lyase
MENVLYWFRNDLRLHDNVALAEAIQHGKILPIYIIDEHELENSFLGFKKTGQFRIKFLIESLNDLKANLKSKGADLIIKIGRTETILFELAKKYEINRIVCTKAVTQDETSTETELATLLKTENIELDLIWQNTLIHVRDLPFQIKFLPAIFTEFRKKVELNFRVRPQIAAIEAISYLSNEEDLSEITFEKLGYKTYIEDERSLGLAGGENAALARLDDYIWNKNLLKEYKQTRNGLSGLDYSSKLSLYLSLGCISPRKVYSEVLKYEQERIKNESTYWLVFELLWRDYFCFIALKFGVRLFKRSGLKQDLNKKWRRNKADFEKWKNGETEDAFINAFMKELAATGYMSNRGRQNVASYFCNFLKLEWWWGAMYFESMLIDYDVCNNWANWNYIAGIGTDPRENRVFNTKTQAEKYDPQGDHQKFWL